MLKTEQSRTTAFTSQLDKPVDQRTLVQSKRKPQYLDVALARGSNDLNVVSQQRRQGGTDKNGIKSVLKKSNGVNVLTGNPAVAEVSETKSAKTRRSGKSVKLGKAELLQVPDAKTLTFQEKAKSDSVRNQKFYHDIDQMLSGKPGTVSSKHTAKNESRVNTVSKSNRRETEPTITGKPSKTDAALLLPARVPKKETVALITKDSLYPPIARQTKEKFASENVQKIKTIQPTRIPGSENETWYGRELKAQERLALLERAEKFSPRNYAKKLQGNRNLKFSAPLKAEPPPLQPSVQTSSTRQTVSLGIPVQVENTISRRHIVADIPVYLPPYSRGNPSLQHVENNNKAAPSDQASNTIISADASKPKRTGAKLSHAPEAFAGPVPGVDTGVVDTQSQLQTQRTSDNPVSERLLREQAEKERALQDQDNLKYFDTEPKESLDIKDSTVNGRLASDPGPRRNQSDRRVDREYVHSESQKENDCDVDFYARKLRADVRNSKMEREDSWIKSQLENTARSSVGMTTYRSDVRGDETRRGSGKYRLEDFERDRNRSYRLQDERERQRYGNRGYPERGNERQNVERERYNRGVRSPESRYERETRGYRRDNEEFTRRENRDYRYGNESDWQSYERSSRDGQRMDRDRVKNSYKNDERYQTHYEGRENGEPREVRDRDFDRDYRRSVSRDARDSDWDRRFNREDSRERRYKGNDYREDRGYQAEKRMADHGRDRLSERNQDESQLRDQTKGKKDEDSKVQYVLKSSNSRSEIKKSQASLKSEPLPDSLPPTATELDKEKAVKSDRNQDMRYQESRADKTSNSEGINRGHRSHHDFRNGELMTPVQEMSIKTSEDGDGERKMQDYNEQGNRVKFLSSTENKHRIEEERRSPWRKDEETPRNGKSPSLIDEAPKHLTANLNGKCSQKANVSNVKGPDSVEYTKERIREKTEEKIKEKQMDRERSMDSQGPTDADKGEGDKDGDVDDVNFDEIETEMDGNELYVCYLLTDDGEKIGPLKLDIDDVQIGLPNPDKMKVKATENEEEGK